MVILWLVIIVKLMATPVQAADYEWPVYAASPSAQPIPTATMTPQPTVTMKPTPTARPNIPFVSEAIHCVELVVAGDNRAAPAEVTFRADTQGKNVSGYKADFGDGESQESSSSSIVHTYLQPGTFEAKGYVRDASDFSYGGTGLCQKTVKVLAAEPLTTQPETGVPMVVWVAIGLMGGVGLMLRKVALAEKKHE